MKTGFCLTALEAAFRFESDLLGLIARTGEPVK
jgi:hypothetical protein